MTQLLKSRASRGIVRHGRSIAIAIALIVTLGVANSAHAIFYHFGLDVQMNCTSANLQSLKINSVFNLDPATNVVNYVIKIPELNGVVKSVAIYRLSDPNVDEVSCSVTGATTIEDLGNSLSGSFALSGAEAIALQSEDYLIIVCVTKGQIVEYAWAIIRKARETIPTVSQWGLVVMTGLVLAAGTIVVRRRRRRIPA